MWREQLARPEMCVERSGDKQAWFDSRLAYLAYAAAVCRWNVAMPLWTCLYRQGWRWACSHCTGMRHHHRRSGCPKLHLRRQRHSSGCHPGHPRLFQGLSGARRANNEQP